MIHVQDLEKKTDHTVIYCESPRDLLIKRDQLVGHPYSTLSHWQIYADKLASLVNNNGGKHVNVHVETVFISLLATLSNHNRLSICFTDKCNSVQL